MTSFVSLDQYEIVECLKSECVWFQYYPSYSKN